MSSDRVYRWLVVAAVVFAAVGVAGVVGRVLVDRSEPRFTVEFRGPGSSCKQDEDTLFLDATTGDVLACSASPVVTGGPLEPGLHRSVTGRAITLAQDGPLTEADMAEVRRYADALATDAGYDQSGLSAVELAPRIAMGLGCLLAVLCGAASIVVTYVQTRPGTR
jgi:hypothetical protein